MRGHYILNKPSSDSPRIALIHAHVVSMQPINLAFARLWPEARPLNLLDDGLSRDVAAAGELDDTICRRLRLLAECAVCAGASAMLFTSSAFGPCIEEVARDYSPMPVLKPYEGMIQEAVRSGKRIGLVVAFKPALRVMSADFPAGVLLDTELAEGASEALARGDSEDFLNAIVKAAQRLRGRGCELIALAQYSMAHAATAVGTAVDLPVITPVDSAVKQLRGLLS